MENYKKRLILSFIINILMIVFFISTLISTIFYINNNPDNVYHTVWGLFRFFTIDGNLLSCIFNFIITFRQFQALRMQNEKEIKEKIISHFLYMISLISACNEIVIFMVVVLIFLPMSYNDIEMIIGLIGSYEMSSAHITIPLLLTFRFLFLDKRERLLKLYEKFYGGIPMLIYGIIMFILCGAKVFTSYDINEGDGNIPYPFLDLYHQSWYFCFLIALIIFIFGFGISFLFDFLNKKFDNLIFPYDSSSEEEDFNKNKENLVSAPLNIEDTY